MNDVVEQVEKRIVTLADGTTADFGKRNNVLQSSDVETGVVTFKVFTGEVINLDLTAIEALGYNELPELAKTYALYAATNKVKVSITAAKLTEVAEETGVIKHTLAEAIQNAVDSLLSGEFSTRSSGGDSEEALDDNIKHFAVAAGIFQKYPFYNAEFASAVKREGDFLLFNDEVDGSVLSKIVSAWEALSTKEKNKAKRDQHFKLVEGDAIKFLLKQAEA